MIEFKKVTKIYETYEIQTYALNEVDLFIEKNEFVAVMGPSGSGKSTLLNIVGCLDKPTKGEYYLEGVNIGELNDKTLAKIRNKKIGFIFQTFNLIHDLTAIENVEIPLLYAGLSTKERKEKAKQMLIKVGLGARLNHYPYQLSGGQQQRVAIARALVNEPLILVADEPTGNLDTNTGCEIMNILTTLHQEGMTILMVTHDREWANYAKRIIQIKDGRILNENY